MSICLGPPTTHFIVSTFNSPGDIPKVIVKGEGRSSEGANVATTTMRHPKNVIEREEEVNNVPGQIQVEKLSMRLIIQNSNTALKQRPA